MNINKANKANKENKANYISQSCNVIAFTIYL